MARPADPTKQTSCVCKRCGKIFLEYIIRIQRHGTGKLCSKKCGRVEKVCPCGKVFRIRLSGHKKGYGKYCSIVCCRKYHVAWNKGVTGEANPFYKKKWSIDFCQKISQAKTGKKRPDMVGENNPRWNGGVTHIRHLIRALHEYEVWRDEVYRRDHFTCRNPLCRKHCDVAHAHHIKPLVRIIEENNIRTIEQALECKEIWDINNGVTLCIPCHRMTYHKTDISANYEKGLEVEITSKSRSYRILPIDMFFP